MILAIMDLEWTSWSSSEIKNIKNPKKEIIQLSVMVFEYKKMKKVDDLNIFIKPVFNSNLSSYISELTGIKQNFIEEKGINFKDALLELLKFIELNQVKKILSNGQDEDILKENCIYHQLVFPNQIHFINLKPFFMEFFKTSISNVQSNNLYKLIPTKLLNTKIHKVLFELLSSFLIIYR